MKFTDIFINKPVLAIVVSLIILLLGFQGFSGMAIRQYPQVAETTMSECMILRVSWYIFISSLV